jgi:dTDP-4-dehydrorhamnose reductase
MMKLMQERSEINVVSDQTGRPTYAADLASCIFHIIFHVPSPEAGIYHYANEGAISWYDFALAIKEIGGYTCNVNPIPSSAYQVPAKRPRYSILNTDKTISSFGLKIPNWRISLKRCMDLLQTETS